ncbi:hypothetical protein ACFPAG_07920 [Vogesella sp. GCM10023246]|uniref:Uncharacterized protein n=1 Tax=Vogesella oryzagri TaxID=3160864 RepID=A0ABV1M2Y3_9NEIS
MARYLIPALEEVDVTSIEEMLMVCAREVEDALISSGASEDEYTRMDLIRLAAPFALEVMKARNAFK